LQTPSAPGTLHALHSAVHPFSQQYPSTHNPFTQSSSDAHGCPLSFLQFPLPSHENMPEHVIDPFSSSSPKGTIVHVPAVNAEALQVLHAASQALSQQTPSTQKPLEHNIAALHSFPLDFWHIPAPLHVSLMPSPQTVEIGSGRYDGVPSLVHASCVQSFPSKGTSVGSTFVTMFPAPSQTMTRQSRVFWSFDGSAVSLAE